MATPDPRLERVSLADLSADPANARKHSPRNLDAIRASLRRFGQQHPLVVGPDNVLVAGSGRLEAMRAEGWTDALIIRTDLEGSDRAAFAIADNRTAELAEWDDEVLATMLATLDGELQEAAGFIDDELAPLLAKAAEDGTVEERDDPPREDEAEALREKWQTEEGQLWTAGRHRILCGDSTSADDMDRLLDGARPTLLVTDPPYGVNYDPTFRSENRVGVVKNDDRADWTETWRLAPCDVAYVWHGGLHAHVVAASLATAGFALRGQMVWAKPKLVMGRGHYHWQHEPCWYAVREGASASWSGDRKQSTLWQFGKDADAPGGHSTQKPLEAMARPIRNHHGDVLDPFLDSGTTLVAAEQEGRAGFGLELNPPYVAIALERLARLGLEPRLASA